MEVNIKPVEV